MAYINAINLEFPIRTSDPSSPYIGQVWYNSTSQTFKGYDGSIVTFTVT